MAKDPKDYADQLRELRGQQDAAALAQEAKQNAETQNRMDLAAQARAALRDVVIP